MLRSIIVHIRRKPKYVREQYALLGAVLFTGAVAFVWTMSLPNRFDGPGLSEVPPETARPFGSFLERIKGQFAAIGSVLGDKKEVGVEGQPADPASTLNITLTSEDFEAIAARTASETPVATTPARPIRIATTTPSAAPAP